MNDAERRRWNDPYWASGWPKKEALTGAAVPFLLDRLAPRPGERVLDVGSGAGISAIALARAVGESGAVVGADISAPLVGYATRRVDLKALPSLRFVVADLQQERIEGAPFDAAMSQFGIMFFDDPVAAFANIRSHLVAGGRLAFACWRTPDLNPWFVGRALSGFLEAPPSPPPGEWAAGPFSLADAELVRSVLADAGWHGIERSLHETTVVVGREVLADEGELAYRGVEPARLEEALRVVEAQLLEFRLEGESYEIPLAFQVFTARA